MTVLCFMMSDLADLMIDLSQPNKTYLSGALITVNNKLH